MSDERARLIAAADQRAAAVAELGESLSTLYTHLRKTFSDVQAYDLTHAWLVETVAKGQPADDE